MALENSGLNYVILRPGGMERPTDSYKETHNVRLSTADKLFGGQVWPSSIFLLAMLEMQNLLKSAFGWC